MTQTAPWRVASGHTLTSAAAAEILELGGSAADATIAAAIVATIAEPLLCSLGGGGLALVKAQGRAPQALDCFAHTPRQRHAGPLDFYPIIGNFGRTTQEFHVGLASMATPGLVAGLFELHHRHGRLPFSRLVEPGVRAARDGVELNAMQQHTLEILEPIVRASDEGARLFGLSHRRGPLPEVGARITNPTLAEFLPRLARHGPSLFYEGPGAQALVDQCLDNGGHLRMADLRGYRAVWRRPLRWRYRDAVLWSSPPPAFGGLMLALASQWLAEQLPAEATFGSADHLRALCEAMAASERMRPQLEQPELLACPSALGQAFRRLSPQAAASTRGTTQISIDDGAGLSVSMTLSNGECSGTVMPGTGIMLNNMLGEEDLNRGGFHAWPLNRRLASMMAPTLVRRGRHHLLLGSGGSNRIRTALAQVICNVIDFNMSLEDAIQSPRLHLERGQLDIELASQWPAHAQDWLLSHYRSAQTWPQRSLFFGGVHAVSDSSAVADLRRHGHAIMAHNSNGSMSTCQRTRRADGKACSAGKA